MVFVKDFGTRTVKLVLEYLLRSRNSMHMHLSAWSITKTNLEFYWWNFLPGIQTIVTMYASLYCIKKKVNYYNTCQESVYYKWLVFESTQILKTHDRFSPTLKVTGLIIGTILKKTELVVQGISIANVLGSSHISQISRLIILKISLLSGTIIWHKKTNPGYLSVYLC